MAPNREKQSESTAPAGPAVLDPVTEAIPAAPDVSSVDPLDVLARRKSDRQEAAWRTLLAAAREPNLKESTVLAAADAAEVLGIAPEWLSVFRYAIALHKDAAVRGGRKGELETAKQVADEAFGLVIEARTRGVEELMNAEQLAQQKLHGAILELHQAGDAAQMAITLEKWFCPLLNESRGFLAFALPSRTDELPPSLSGLMIDLKLIDGHGPVALTANSEEAVRRRIADEQRAENRRRQLIAENLRKAAEQNPVMVAEVNEPPDAVGMPGQRSSMVRFGV